MNHSLRKYVMDRVGEKYIGLFEKWAFGLQFTGKESICDIPELWNKRHPETPIKPNTPISQGIIMMIDLWDQVTSSLNYKPPGENMSYQTELKDLEMRIIDDIETLEQRLDDIMPEYLEYCKMFVEVNEELDKLRYDLQSLERKRSIS